MHSIPTHHDSFWPGVLLRPGPALRGMAERDSSGYIWLIGAGLGLLLLRQAAELLRLGDAWDLGQVLLGIGLLGPVAGLACVALLAALIWTVSDFFKGSARYREIFEVSGWSLLPLLLALPVYAILQVVQGTDAFTSAQYVALYDGRPPLYWLLLVLWLALASLSSIWLICGIASLQGWSHVRAASVALLSLVLAAGVGIVVALLGALMLT